MTKLREIDYEDLTREDLETLGEPIYWGPPDEERYHDTDIEDAIENVLDGCPPDPFPEILEIVAVRPVKITAEVISAVDILDSILENLDENYGDPEGDQTEACIAMKEAADNLACVVVAEYVPWVCEEVLRVTVRDVKARVREWG